MSLADRLLNEVTKLVGLQAPNGRVVALSENGIDLAVDFSSVDRMSCAFRELRLRVPHLAGCDVHELHGWANALAQKVTYLLEGLGPIEIDEQAGQVLVRSDPPDQQPDGTEYYEVLLESDTNGNFTLRRYRAEKGRPGRKWVDVTMTHEVLRKLVGDLLATMPAP